METSATDSGEGSTGGDGGAEAAASPVRRGRALPDGGLRPGSSAEAAGHHGARRSSPPPPTPPVPRSASTATRLAPPPPRAASATTRTARTQSNARERLGAGRSCHFVAPREQKCSSQRDFRGFGSRAVAKNSCLAGLHVKLLLEPCVKPYQRGS
jgi:hypothetical protein